MKVKFSRCISNNLTNVPNVDGQLIFIKDTGELYLDVNNNRVRIEDKNLIQNVSDLDNRFIQKTNEIDNSLNAINLTTNNIYNTVNDNILNITNLQNDVTNINNILATKVNTDYFDNRITNIENTINTMQSDISDIYNLIGDISNVLDNINGENV